MNEKVKKYGLIGIYLVAIVTANLLTTIFGATISILNAFLFIGLDLTTRDNLHEYWKNNHLFIKMLSLIVLGSILSYLINRNAARIAIASMIAFFASGIVDFIVYSICYKKKWIIKTNVSNIFSGATDSLVFPTIAFGGFIWWVTLGQFIAKVFGGGIWSLILKRYQPE